MQFFVTATGTDIGKTFCTLKLCQKLKSEGKNVMVLKPIISGFDDNDDNSDSAKILKILDKDLNQKNLDEISPYRFKAPLSPNVAADLENKEIDFSKLVGFCKNKILEARKNNSYLFIEGAGGVMTPITNQKTFLDLIKELEIPVILVTANYLGTISHTLTAIESLKAHQIEIDRIIFNVKDNEIDKKGNIETLRKFTKIPIDEN